MMTATICPTGQQLRAFALGHLPEEQSDELFEHLRTCEGCRSELDTVEDTEDSLIASLRQADDSVEFSAEPDCQVALAKALGALALTSEDNVTNLETLPRSIGEYEVIRLLGQGGMGNVFLAHHTKLGREVALKVLAGRRLANSRTKERFEAEMRAIGTLSHPNIVNAYDAREVDGTAVLVTEFIDGFDLTELVRRIGPLPRADACEIVRQAAVALEYTSGLGFVHRDVKPSNIMLSKAGEVKLLDLGLARLQRDQNDRPEITGTGQAMGTADFVAPEQVTDCRTVDVRADIYSLGCTLFKLLTGNAPFADERHVTAFAKMTAHVSTQPPSLVELLPGAPPALVKLVDSMLAKRPEERPQSPRSVAEQIAAFTGPSNLTQLAEKALEREPQLEAPRSSSVLPSALPFLRRRVAITTTIALALGAWVLGISMGFVIKIKYADGTQATLPFPEGAELSVEASPDNQVHPTPDAPPENSRAHRTPEAPPKEIRIELDGVWRVISAEMGGRPVPEPLDSRMAFFSGRHYFMDGERVIKNGTYTLQQSRGAATLDIRDDDTRDVKLGIVRAIDETRIEFCVNEAIPGGRPTRFESIPGSGYLLMTLERDQELPKVLEEALLEQQASGKGMLRARYPVEPYKTTNATDLETNQSKTINDLKQIGIAFHNFHEVYQKFPGSMNTKEGGASFSKKKTFPFSWRVAILPFVEQNELYEQYRFDEPWDSENNLKLLEKIPDVYRSPLAVLRQPVGHTNYLGFSGEHTALGDGGGVSMRSFFDGTSNTILIVEAKDSVAWTEPTDIPFEMLSKVQDVGKPLTYLRADGSVGTMNELVLEELIKWITRDQGEVIDQ